jgi:hypothetical protein
MTCAGLASWDWRSPVNTWASTCDDCRPRGTQHEDSHMAESPLMAYLLCMLAGAPKHYLDGGDQFARSAPVCGRLAREGEESDTAATLD